MGLFKNLAKALKPVPTKEEKFNLIVDKDGFIALRTDKNDDYKLTAKEWDEFTSITWAYQNVMEYNYKTTPLTLQDDGKAIHVLIDGICLGDIKTGSTGHVRKIMPRFISAHVWMLGGKYKHFYRYTEDDKDKVGADKMSTDPVAQLYIAYKL